MFALLLPLSSLLLLCLAAVIASVSASYAYTPTDSFLLNCGAFTDASDGSRNWEADTQSKLLGSDSATTSMSSTPGEQSSSVSQVPYMTARVFNASSIYTFPVSPGPKFLRLYFYPATYANLDKSRFLFSATANRFTLLSNFSAFLTVSAAAPPVAYLVKEFIVNVQNTRLLALTFSPSPDSYAFVNGIEIVSIPDHFYMNRITDSRTPLVGQTANYEFDETTALETMYRLNVGGAVVPGTRDTGMFRQWDQDDFYIFGAALGFTPSREIPIRYTAETPNYTAPEVVYTTSRTMGKQGLNFNLTWLFPVDSGFYYLLRLHFCEIQLEVTLQNQRVFRIFINNVTAEEEADVIHWAGGTGIPVFRDYVVWFENRDGRHSKQDLWLAMHPNLDTHPEYADALLNGLEIFKLNGSEGSLAAPNPGPSLAKTDSIFPATQTKKKRSSTAGIIAGVCGGVFLLFLLAFLLWKKMKRRHLVDHAKSSWDVASTESRSTKTSGSSLPSDRCRRFLLAEVKLATDDFDDGFVIGRGGFGKVYKGLIGNCATTAAIKRLNPSSNQGALEFQTEIGLLSKLRHLHLVSLIGYCNDDREMILVYEYMAHGTLRQHLYNSNNPPLPWKTRLQICIGAARGLHYLHTGAKRMVIHRDVKSTNILLDEKWVAKVSDFGLSKLGPKVDSRGHVSTVVKGSFGYVDPEYYKRQQLTDKSDVYSFGVVLFEVLCARPVIIPELPKSQASLAQWARYCYRRGALDQIVDPNLRGQIAPECLQKFAEVGDSCLRDEGIERPSMNDVVWSLEFALQLQEAAEKAGRFSPANASSPLLTPTDVEDPFSGSTEQTSFVRGEEQLFAGSEASMMKSENVFSELMNPTAR